MSQQNPQPATQSDQTVWIYLSYILGWLFALIGLAVVKDDENVRFHCAQAFVYWVALYIVFIILSLLVIVGWILMPLVGIAAFVCAILVMLKAAKGERYKMPVIGDFAEKNVMGWFK